MSDHLPKLKDINSNPNSNYLTSLNASYLTTFIVLFTTVLFMFIQAIKSNHSYIVNLFSLEI